MLKFGMLNPLFPAVTIKNLRTGRGSIGKNTIHNTPCVPLGLAVVFQPMKKHNTLRLALLAATLPVAAIIASCTETVNTRGQIITPSRLSQIQPGTTSRQDVLQLLGSPSMQGTMNENRWYYVTSVVGTKAFEPHDLKSRQVVIIDFDPASDTVAALTQKTEADGKEIAPAEGSTPTHGQSLGIVDQLLGNLSGIMGK